MRATPIQSQARSRRRQCDARGTAGRNVGRYPSFGQVRDDSRFVARQSVTTTRVALGRRPVEHGRAERLADAGAAGVREDGGEAEEPGVVGSRRARCACWRRSIEQPIAEPTTRPPTTATKVAYFGSSKSSSHSAIASSSGGGAERREDGRRVLVRGQRELELGENGNLVARRPPDLEPVRQLGHGRLGSLADRVDVLLAEAEPEPRVDEGRGRRRERSRSATCAPPRPSGPPRARRDRARPRPPRRRGRRARPRRSAPRSGPRAAFRAGSRRPRRRASRRRPRRAPWRAPRSPRAPRRRCSYAAGRAGSPARWAAWRCASRPRRVVEELGAVGMDLEAHLGQDRTAWCLIREDDPA